MFGTASSQASITTAVSIALAPLPRSSAATNDSTRFNMFRSAGAVSCLKSTADGTGHDQRRGASSNMHIEVYDLPSTTEFTLFVITTQVRLSFQHGIRAT